MSLEGFNGASLSAESHLEFSTLANVNISGMNAYITAPQLNFQTLSDVVIDGFNGGVDVGGVGFTGLTNSTISGLDALVTGTVLATDFVSSHLRAFDTRLQATQLMISL